jgi:hypothetical protein
MRSWWWVTCRAVYRNIINCIQSHLVGQLLTLIHDARTHEHKIHLYLVFTLTKALYFYIRTVCNKGHSNVAVLDTRAQALPSCWRSGCILKVEPHSLEMFFILLPSESRHRAIWYMDPKAAGKYPAFLGLQNIGSMLLRNFRTHLPGRRVSLRRRPQHECTQKPQMSSYRNRLPIK